MALTTSTITNNIRGENNRTTSLSKFRDRLANWLESPVGQSLTELNTIAFLYGGRYLEIGRRWTGLSYVSSPDLGHKDQPRSELTFRSPLQLLDKPNVLLTNL